MRLEIRHDDGSRRARGESGRVGDLIAGIAITGVKSHGNSTCIEAT